VARDLALLPCWRSQCDGKIIHRRAPWAVVPEVGWRCRCPQNRVASLTYHYHRSIRPFMLNVFISHALKDQVSATWLADCLRPWPTSIRGWMRSEPVREKCSPRCSRRPAREIRLDVPLFFWRKHHEAQACHSSSGSSCRYWERSWGLSRRMRRRWAAEHPPCAARTRDVNGVLGSPTFDGFLAGFDAQDVGGGMIQAPRN